MRRLAGILRLVLFLALAGTVGFSANSAQARDNIGIDTVALADLPPEAQRTMQLVRRGGPFPYPQKDGSTFGNFERRLPLQARGYYREFTVPTPGRHDRGARRLIAGNGRSGDVATSG